MAVIIKGFDRDDQLKKHFKHATSDSVVSAYLGDRPGMKRINTLPICPRCERIGLRDKGWLEKMIMACPHCGYQGTTDTVYSEYKKENKFL